MDETTALRSAEATLRALESAWNNGDAAAWAAKCTPDVDFINLLGMYVKGTAAVSAIHAKIFAGPYAGSRLTFAVERLRILSADYLVAIVPGELRIPEGPVKGIVRTVATMLLARDRDNWLIASFQNTKREATQADHTRVMIDAVSRE